MDSAQSSGVPAKGQKPGWSDLSWLPLYALRGFLELVRARIIFSRLKAKDIPLRNRASREAVPSARQSMNQVHDLSIARISYVLPRISDRLPWRSDCLIQAIAGQNWLLALGEPSEIQIGVERPAGGDFGAHAWLKHGDSVVTGGDIAQYEVILSEPDVNRDGGAPT